MYQGLRSMEVADKPSINDWEVVSDAVNMLEMLTSTNGGWWLDCDGDKVQIKDTSGLLPDAVLAMANAGRRYMEHGVLRLDAQGIATIRAVLEDYAALIQVMPARVMIHCHRRVEKRMQEIMRGQTKPHDVVVKKRKT